MRAAAVSTKLSTNVKGAKPYKFGNF